MGVKCSLLGHDYADPEVERERAERGDEVVRTAKRVERCRNCDHERTVSENTEVTALSAAAGVVREPDGTVVAATDEPDGTNGDGPRPEGDTREPSNGGISFEAFEKTANALGSTTEDESSAPDEPTGETAPTNGAESADGNGPAEEDERVDTVAIDEARDTESKTHDSPGREPGEWPTEPDDGPATAGTRESSGLGSSGSLAGSHERWPGETDATANPPGTAESQPAAWDATGGSDAGVTAVSSGSGRRPGSAFACGSCGFTTAVADSPLRAGDICPECQHGYLAWETRKG